MQILLVTAKLKYAGLWTYTSSKGDQGRIFLVPCTSSSLKIRKSCASARCDAYTHTDLSEWEEGEEKTWDTVKRYEHRIMCKEPPASLTCSSTSRAASQQNLEQAQSGAGQNFLFLGILFL